MASNSTTASLPYEEPGIVIALILASFLYLLNAVGFAADRLVFCGLLGQIFLGVAWGTPGAGWLSTEIEHTVVQLGYLGLLLLVYEGGLSTNFAALKANVFTSIAVATTGICAPIGLSYSLMRLIDASPIQSFAAGAALCSTSLGTTFTVMKSTGLAQTRMGVVLSSSAILDDVVGLVMVQVIQSLGGDASSFKAATVIRPVFVALAFIVGVPVLAWYIIRPLTLRLNALRDKHVNKATVLLNRREIALAIHAIILIGLVTATSYAGTSNLLGAYVAGASIQWWDTEMPHVTSSSQKQGTAQQPQQQSVHLINAQILTSGGHLFEKYYQPVLSRLLRPFFFASIGFSIPITRMFRGSIVWKGLVYTLLMIFAKVICGLWLVRWPASQTSGSRSLKELWPPSLWKLLIRKLQWRSMPALSPASQENERRTEVEAPKSQNASLKSAMGRPGTSPDPNAPVKAHGPKTQGISQSQNADQASDRASRKNVTSQGAGKTSSHQSQRRPLSLYPAAILGSAMVARGEIGFLISSIGQSSGIMSSDEFLVVTWAIMLCTILGPVVVGLLVRRVRQLQEAKTERGDCNDALGVWGVS